MKRDTVTGHREEGVVSFGATSLPTTMIWGETIILLSCSICTKNRCLIHSMLSKWIRTVYICFLLNHHSRSCIFFAAASARGADVSNFQVNTKLCQCTERLRGPCHIRLWRKYRSAPSPLGLALPLQYYQHQEWVIPGGVLLFPPPSKTFSFSFLRALPPWFLLAVAIFLTYNVEVFLFVCFCFLRILGDHGSR